MKSTITFACILLAPLFLTGCPQSETLTSGDNAPKTDFVFSQAKRDTLLEERKPISQAIARKNNKVVQTQ